MNDKSNEILKTVKDTASAIFETTKEMAQEAGQKIEEKKRVLKLESQIKKARSQMDGIYAELGRQLYDERCDVSGIFDKETAASVQQAYQSLDRLQRSIENWSAQIHSSSDTIICPQCGRACSSDYQYCPVCRAKLSKTDNDNEQGGINE